MIHTINLVEWISTKNESQVTAVSPVKGVIHCSAIGTKFTLLWHYLFQETVICRFADKGINRCPPILKNEKNKGGSWTVDLSIAWDSDGMAVSYV
jgi:hypothetical protein